MEKLLGLFFSTENKNNISRLWKISLKHKWLLVFAVITLILSTFQALYIPLKLNGFIKIFSTNDVSQAFSNNASSYFLLFVFNNFFESLHIISIKLFTLSFVKSMREYYVKSLFSKDIEFFDQKKTSDLFALLTEDIQNLTDTSILELFGFIKTISKGIGAGFLMFYFYFKLSCFLIIILPIILFIARNRHKQAMKEHKNIREQRHSSHNIVLESLENIKTVKAFSTEEKEIDKYEIQLKEMWNEQYKFLIKSALTRNVIGILFIAVMFLIIKLGIYFAKKAGEKEEDLTSNLFPFIIYCGMLIGTFNEIAEKFEKIQKSIVIAEKLFNIIDYIPNIKNAPYNEHSFMKIKGDIEFKNINFSYPTKKEVEILNDFNLKINKGMRLGIVGSSGSGKSTIISLLQRLYNCGNSNENILLNNQNNNKNLKKLDEYIELPNVNNDTNLLDSKLIDSDTEIIKIESDTNNEYKKKYR